MALTSLISTPVRLGSKLFGSELFESIVSPNGIDRFGEMIDPVWSLRDVRARIEKVDHLTPRSTTLVLRPNSNWGGFAPGQHVGLTVEVDGVLTTRFYSPASSATRKDGCIELTVTTHPDGKVSEHLFAHARAGMIVGISSAEGEFVLPTKAPERLLLISGGSGITPVMSMLRTLIDKHHKGDITFVHYARSREDAIYADELAALPGVNVVHVFTREQDGSDVPSGRLTRAQLAKIAPGWANSETFVCGPNSLIDAAEKIWAKEAIDVRLHTESFVLPEPVIVGTDATGSVSFAKSGCSCQNDGSVLLDQAEAAGLSPRSGCRMGICHTCIAYVEEGVVRDVRSGELKTVKDEYIQICVHAPVGDLEIAL